MANKNQTFRIKHRGGVIVSMVLSTIFASFMLISTVARFSASARGEALSWKNSWWITALLFGLFIFSAVKDLRDIFVQLTLAKEGIWYHQLGRKRFIPWEHVQGIEFTRAYLTKEKLYRLILKAERREDKRTFLGMKRDHETIPLWVFVDRWLGSELRDEIKRLNPSLPMQEGLHNL